MRYLLLSSLLFSLCCCAPAIHKRVISAADAKAITIFSDTTHTYLYKNKIDLYGHYLSGIMMIKPVGSNYKVAITTEFGAKIMDFELTNGQFIMHDCIAEMKHKRILKVVEQDMKLLLGSPKELFIQHSDDTTAHLPDASQAIYTIGASSKEVTKIESYKKGRKNVEITLSRYINSMPGKIVVTHTGIPMNIELNLLKAKEDAAE
jgi:hypothetical protein